MHERSHKRRRRHLWTIAGIVIGVAALVPIMNYRAHDRESGEITADVRKGVSGQFIGLTVGTVHYELLGPPNGRVVVLVAGFSIPYYLWDHTAEPLANAGYRVLRYDLYGRGYSDRPAVTYDGELFDRQLAEPLRALRISRSVHLVGSSMGGPIAVTFAVRHPEIVQSVTLIGPGYFAGGKLPYWLRWPLLGEYEMTVSVVPRLTQSQARDLLHRERFPEYVNQFPAQLRFRGFRRALLSTLRYYVGSDVTPDFRRLGRIGIPVLLIWGEADQEVPLALSVKIRSDLPQSELHVVSDAAHVPQYEQPQTVNPLLVQFFAKASHANPKAAQKSPSSFNATTVCRRASARRDLSCHPDCRSSQSRPPSTTSQAGRMLFECAFGRSPEPRTVHHLQGTAFTVRKGVWNSRASSGNTVLQNE